LHLVGHFYILYHDARKHAYRKWIDAHFFQSNFSLRLYEKIKFIIHIDKFIIHIDKPKTETDTTSYLIVSEFKITQQNPPWYSACLSADQEISPLFVEHQDSLASVHEPATGTDVEPIASSSKGPKSYVLSVHFNTLPLRLDLTVVIFPSHFPVKFGKHFSSNHVRHTGFPAGSLWFL
jgi:hypothetical protein